MRHPAKPELSLPIKSLPVKAIEQRSRSGAIEASIMEAKPHTSHNEPKGPF